ncbi:hypothetical protein HHI36_005159 [Cryptolaemus montrouzieri]|uniref:Uncharacterized protein n=1 Tax=Cryptolaemus montrouzieri TaxID=559131 RepID=A0ABD2NTC3_9CUCU
MGRRIACLWIPSHSYIHANDIVDILANKGRYLPDVSEVKGGPEELWPAHKKEIWRDWRSEFLRIGESKGKTYVAITRGRHVGSPPWFHMNDWPRFKITQMNRLR